MTEVQTDIGISVCTSIYHTDVRLITNLLHLCCEANGANNTRSWLVIDKRNRCLYLTDEEDDDKENDILPRATLYRSKWNGVISLQFFICTNRSLLFPTANKRCYRMP